ncbi:hypothetical protein, partial [Escherichia coli]|uniref:hypothetical protein n=1 Tax=Escherichia coli TaxID=562 RepID=UPI0019536DB5
MDLATRMTAPPSGKHWLHRALGGVLARLPARARAAVHRALVACDPDPDLRLQLKLAETREELESCFRLLHDAYVASGYMA